MSSVPRFFVARNAVDSTQVILSPEDAHHARSVLRLRAGEAIEVCLSDGLVHYCTLTEVEAGRVAAEINQSGASTAEPRLRITVVQALPKNDDKVEQVLQHGTEIGAAGFFLFLSARSVARPDEARLKKRMERWRGIVKAAAQQSGRASLPEVAWGGSTSGLPVLTGDNAFVLHEKASVPLRHALENLSASAPDLKLLVGPEGGFTEEEAADAASRGAVVVSLGPRVLRTETAALTALAQILFVRD